jgi:CBS domain-containing membrane protein
MKSHRWFGFILPGATLRDRVWACVGSLVGVGLTALVSTALFPHDPRLPFLVAPIGASAVLLFAIPASPLAQPWPIIGGNTISALAGIVVCRFLHDPMTAAGMAVSLAIAAMSLTRCLHPPGGAAALTAVLGAHSPMVADWSFAFAPVALNSILLVLCGWIFHKFSRHRYPHRTELLSASPPAAATPGLVIPNDRTFEMDDLNAALLEYGETLDVRKDDLNGLFRLVEQHAKARKLQNDAPGSGFQ